MQQFHQKLLWTQQWLNGVSEIRTPPKEPEDPSDDAQATAHATDLQSRAAGTDTSFEIVSHKNDEDASNTDFGVVSMPDSTPPWEYTQQPPPSHCASCGWPFPQSPPLTYSEQMPPQQLIPDLELAGRGDHCHAFSDLRSPSIARQRDRSAREKYYGFRYVKRGELGFEGVVEGTCFDPFCGAEEDEENENEHADSDDDKEGEDASPRAGTPCSARSCGTERPPRSTTAADHAPPHPTEEIDKHTLYRLAQLYPRPPKNHHRHIDKVIASLSQRVDKRREERKHQKAILRDELEDLSPQKMRINRSQASCTVSQYSIGL
jgi:hypothetical protein